MVDYLEVVAVMHFAVALLVGMWLVVQLVALRMKIVVTGAV